MKYLLQNSQRVVIKLGTRILADGPTALDEERIKGMASQMASYRKQGIEVLLVSSGAVALGMEKLGLKRRPTSLPQLQACASVGQSLLVDVWQKAFSKEGVVLAQVLLTREDMKHRKSRQGIRDTLDALLAQGVLPLINENDAVSAAEIKFGDNDILSASVAQVAQAALLVILSKAPGLIDKKGTQQVVPVVTDIIPSIVHMAESSGDKAAMGGMISKIEAAKIAMDAGVGVFIGSGEDPKVLDYMLTGQAEGTFFLPYIKNSPLRKRWLAFFDQPLGSLQVDAGTERLLQSKNPVLLAKGIKSVEGDFNMGDCVTLVNSNGELIGRGLTNYSRDQIEGFMGLSNEELKRQYPRLRRWEVMQTEALVVF